MSGIVYDTGALLAGERRHRGRWALHEQSLASGVVPIVLVLVLVLVRRAAREPLSASPGCQVTPDTEDLGKAAGAICGRTGISDVIDALVVATGLRQHALVVTSLMSRSPVIGRSTQCTWPTPRPDQAHSVTWTPLLAAA